MKEYKKIRIYANVRNLVESFETGIVACRKLLEALNELATIEATMEEDKKRFDYIRRVTGRALDILSGKGAMKDEHRGTG